MSIAGLMFRFSAARGDKKRDSAIALPAGVTECHNISYGSFGEDNLLDVYYPQGTTTPLPTIVSIHGGAYVYGSKEIYRRFGMDMAKRGFAFVNFNYRLAPKWKFPTPLWDTCAVLEWVKQNCRRYFLDPERIILIGDSAGAQLASQFAAMYANPDYAARMGLKIPNVNIRAVGLYCGLYDIPAFAVGNFKGIADDYLGKKFDLTDPRLDVLGALNDSFPPAFITTSCNDFLNHCAAPLQERLSAVGVETEFHCYGTPEAKGVGHVFHVNIIHPEAVKCNNDAAAFFRKHI